MRDMKRSGAELRRLGEDRGEGEDASNDFKGALEGERRVDAFCGLGEDEDGGGSERARLNAPPGVLTGVFESRCTDTYTH